MAPSRPVACDLGSFSVLSYLERISGRNNTEVKVGILGSDYGANAHLHSTAGECEPIP